MLPYYTEAIRRICRLVGISVQSEIRGDCLFIFLPLYNLFNLLALWVLPLYSLTETPRNTTGHGRGGVVHFVQKFKQESTFHRKVRNVVIYKNFIAKIHVYPTRFYWTESSRESHHIVSKTPATIIPKECSSNLFIFLSFVKYPWKTALEYRLKK